MDISSFLQEKFTEIQKRNARFSLRSLSKKAGISPGSLSEILKGQRPLSISNADKIARAMQMSPQDYETLLCMMTPKSETFFPTRVISEAELSYITNWEYYAILSLMNTDDFVSDATWIAKRLGITLEASQKCIDNLLQIGIVGWQEGRLVRLRSSLTTTVDIPSKALREAHHNHIKKAAHSLENIAVEMRDFSSITMPMDPERLPEAKKIITRFRRSLTSLMESGKKKEVYTLNIQLYPLSVPMEKA